MASITIKNIDPELYERLKQQASEHRRSINSEAIVCLERSLLLHSLSSAEEWIKEGREIRESVTKYVISDEELDRAKREGRL
ncbi:MAG: Arc family DNA-binding protein [Kiritimatiellales bacterium]|nr:Arc family DNA-binding protein [Kiritimatiellales bacterium]